MSGSATLLAVAVSAALASPAPPAQRASEPQQPPSTSASPTSDTGMSVKTASGVVTGGVVLITLGVAAGVFVGLPALGLRRNSREAAKNATYEVRQQRYMRRAQRRENVAFGAFAVSGVLTAIGITRAVVGVKQRNRARRRTAVSPIIGPRMTGLSATLTF